MTTIVGLLPMMLERSIQAAFLQPIVVALAAGVFVAFFVTLLMVPSLYSLGIDLSRRIERGKLAVRRRLPGGGVPQTD